ncbi:hypothetical protein JCM5350_004481 [Sporobolomyces pararoseus]
MSTPHLPPELLEDIFSQLSSSKSALYNLSLSCKTFCHICKPFLYSHITITTGEQRRKLMEVKKEDAQLVKKLVIKGEKSTRREIEMDGADNSIGSGIIVDLFSGDLLDILVIEVLHLSYLYENVNEQPNLRTLPLKAATKLVELSIQYHGGGGDLWRRVLEDIRLCPRLVRLGSLSVSSFHRYFSRWSAIGSIMPRKFVGKLGDYELGEVSFYHRSLGERLGVFVSNYMGENRNVGKKLNICFVSTWTRCIAAMPQMIQEHPHIKVLAIRPLGTPDAGICRRLLESFQSNPITTPSFLSFPFSRSILTPDTLSLFSSIEDLGIELHFSRDEEEVDTISLIPQSFVKFVEKQKKLKEE